MTDDLTREDDETIRKAFTLSAARSNVLLAVGTKGTGKSEWCRRLYRSWPLDKVAIDVNGDADPGDDAQVLRPPVPGALPWDPEGKPVNVHYLADTRSPTYRDDLDAAIGLGAYPKDRTTLVWVDELGEVCKGAQSTPPNLRTLLMQSRHHSASLLMACPRPMNIDPLAIMQADQVAIFDTPNEDDLEKLRANFGPDQGGEQPLSLRDFIRLCRQVWARGPYWHVLMVRDGPKRKMLACPPLPITQTSGPPS